MGVGAARAAIVAIGVAVLVGLAWIGTRPRELAGYEVRGGEVVQVPLTCESILAGGGLEAVGEPTGVEVPQDAGLEDSPGLTCPEDGPVWIGVFAVSAVLVVGATAWGWGYVGHRAGRAAPDV